MKRLLFLLFMGVCTLGAYSQRIVDLTQATTSPGTDLIVVEQSDSTRSITKRNMWDGDSLFLPDLASSNTLVLTPTSTGQIDTLETTDLATAAITVTGLWTFDNLVADSIQVDSIHVNSHAQIDDVTISAGTATLTSLVSGTITGGTMICLHTVAKYVFTDLDSCRNVAHFNDQASVIDFTLPGATAGLTVAFFDIGGGVITIDPVDGTDTIYLNGESVGAGDAIDSPGNVGDFIVLQAIDDTRWITWGRSGVFVDGGAD